MGILRKPGKQKKYTTMKKREARNFYIYTAPWLIGFLVLTLYPILYSFYLMFTNMNLTGIGEFVGLDNWKYAFTDDTLFRRAFLNTLKYVFMFVPCSIILAFFVALLLSKKVKGLGFFRTAFYIPYITSGVAVTILWGWIFQKDFGIINYILSLVGIKGPNWLGDKNVAMISIVILSLWTIGNNIIIMLAGIQDIPQSYYESAQIDGAGSLRQTFYITLPLCTPTIYFNLIVTVIAAFQVFQQPLILTNGGPLNSTYTAAMHLYNNGFLYGKMGYASMMAWSMFAVIMLITIVVVSTSKFWVFYDD
ncbi:MULTISPECIES: carbohydrate ABC transporter permease [Blautia]|jgi:multiple sugar transport system permease protein|nr:MULTISPECIES: sugar ABC transporter permease [Blautia]MCQ4644977.1 sugar ABC transporter permease [Blautia marasmi]MCQ4869399.1 sugar ABC transporter permease [Blautia producta]UOX60709.1 sugar ABC transporter permease [Clostridia bacterium UC5.1-1D4]MCA5963912.1 sugar ABC transporter permease [Blautia parvula]MCB4350987.1 sugar ABC transporter permease [Blautia sp. RD014232]